MHPIKILPLRSTRFLVSRDSDLEGKQKYVIYSFQTGKILIISNESLLMKPY